MIRTIDQAPAELADAVREFFPADQWDAAVSVAYLESGWNPFAEANTVTDEFPCGAVIGYQAGYRISAERSIGWFQINACNLPSGWKAEHLFNTRHNVGTAHMLWDQASNWRPWLISAEALGLPH